MLKLLNELEFRPQKVAMICAFSATMILYLLGSDAHASNGEGFFSISASSQTESLDISAIDPTTLLPLPSTFLANEAGEYGISGLLVLDGDTDNPIGDFEITGLGDPHIQTRVAINRDGSSDSSGIGLLLFMSFISGIDFIYNTGATNQIETIQTTTTTLDSGTPSEPSFLNTRVFLDTSDGETVYAEDASTGGPVNIPGTTIHDSGSAPLPALPSGTMAISFGVLVTQVDLAFFGLEDTSIQLTSVSRTEIFEVPNVPLPPALFLFASALAGLWRLRVISVSNRVKEKCL